MATRKITRRAAAVDNAQRRLDALVEMRDAESLHFDTSNPRKSSPARMGLLRLSLAKLGFLMPLVAQRSSGLLLSGHQRTTVALDESIHRIPVMSVDIRDEDVRTVNLMANRTTNDFNAMDTGAASEQRIDLQYVTKLLENLPDPDHDNPFAANCKLEDLTPLVKSVAHLYDQKAALAAMVMMRFNVQIPVVASDSGVIVNGVNRAFGALESGVKEWPVVRIPDEYAEAARVLLNYLSMDYFIDDDFKDLLRAGAFRRISNDKGTVPKSYRFWANGCKATIDRDSYSPEAWNHFRHVHGNDILDFGAGLCKVAPFLQGKGMDAIDFEPYRFNPDRVSAEPDPDYSREKAREFLDTIADPKKRFSSIFLSAVMNSIPFPEDRLKVLAIVHALCSRDTAVYGTCRDISDHPYEYGGARRGVYFNIDTEPGVRLGDITSRPKIQKFHSQDEARNMFSRFWRTVEFWPGGNVFFFKLTNPMMVNYAALRASLEFEFELPYLDRTTMGLSEHARAAFRQRLRTEKV